MVDIDEIEPKKKISGSNIWFHLFMKSKTKKKITTFEEPQKQWREQRVRSFGSA